MPATFVKSRRPPGPGFFEVEAAGLAWIAVRGGPPVPEVLRVSSDSIEIQRVEAATPTPEAAFMFGAQLAVLHDAGAEGFGAPPPGAPDAGWIGDLPMEYAQSAAFEEFWSQRLLATAERAARRRGLAPDQLERVRRFCARLADGEYGCGPAEPASRLHGDLWSGNVLWGRDAVWLIDPAAHGGHRESDLAMLALFGAPHLPRILEGYQSVHPLADGWRERIGLHQLWPLLVHAALFGGGYGRQAIRAMESVLPR